MKTPTALSVTSSQREQTSLRSQVPRLPRSNVCSTRDLENPSASVHRKRFSTPSLTLKFLCAGKLNPRDVSCLDPSTNVLPRTTLDPPLLVTRVVRLALQVLLRSPTPACASLPTSLPLIGLLTRLLAGTQTGLLGSRMYLPYRAVSKHLGTMGE